MFSLRARESFTLSLMVTETRATPHSLLFCIAYGQLFSVTSNYIVPINTLPGLTRAFGLSNYVTYKEIAHVTEIAWST
jgi:hypothetical protein